MTLTASALAFAMTTSAETLQGSDRPFPQRRSAPEVLGRYETRLDRKLERVLVMVLKPQELRRAEN